MLSATPLLPLAPLPGFSYARTAILGRTWPKLARTKSQVQVITAKKALDREAGSE